MQVRGMIALWLLGFAQALYAAPADDIKALVEQGKPAEAYALGSKYPDQLGNPAFDFFYGIAAIDSGHAGEGVLALERYLLSFPDNVSARQQLARGYYLIGDDARARVEFETLRKLNPPADVIAVIDRFLDSIRLRETRYSLSTGAYVELGVGHDSNVNAGPATANIFLPGFGLLPLAPTSQKTSANFASLGAGGYISYPIQPGLALFAQGQGERKFHDKSDTRDFEVGNYNLAGGVSVLRNKHLFRFSGLYGVVTLGSDTFRTSAGGSAEWHYQVDDFQSFNLGAQAAQLDYPGDNRPRNADFYGISAGYKLLFRHRWEPILSLGVNAGEQDSRTGRPDLVPRSWGASVTVNVTPVPKWGVQLGYIYQDSDYRGPDLFAFPDARHDRYEAIVGAVSYLYSRNLSFRAEALFSKNRSNADVYAFTRDAYGVKVRYEFK